MAIPLVVNESLIRPFKYWHNGVQEGGIYNNELYTRFRSFSLADRLKAYEMAFEQAKQGVAVCISASAQDYTVWLRLRPLTSAAQPAARRQG
ncbi:hypothetical protein PGN35_016400 [Nodosilinea sp. PGN35]|uniref:hypothetical protein n=1 Tax=Nodosilinea sp. PGN35 TaxID=3020489 RepID=UPI0023B26150|nr:hypothetical protein [Nodosilinea sp. TSF1-S3]MDF0366211.1 hypothetical protein [Nodosilinea sp. TSF1-S3]